LTDHEIVGHDDWLAARVALLEKEKEFTRARDALSRFRRELPWERVEDEYVFDGPDGPETLGDLFDGRSQLVVYHFMFEPDRTDDGCPSCSFWADNFDPNVIHLAARDTTLVAVSRAPIERLEAYRKRMGWGFRWVSSGRTDFNRDYGVWFPPDDRDQPVYNYGTLSPGRADREGMSSSSTTATRSSTRTRPTRAGSTCSTRLTTTSTSSRNDVTRKAGRSSGCAGTTNTTADRFHVKTGAAATVTRPCGLR